MKSLITWNLLKQTYHQWNEDEGPRLAAALAFYTLSSLAPLILFALVIAGSLFGEQAARDELLAQIDQLMGPAGVITIEGILSSAKKSSSSFWAGLAGLVVLLVSAGGVFVELQNALNLISRSPKKPSAGLWEIVQQRLFSMGLVLGTGFLLLVSLIISALLAALGKYLTALSPVFKVGIQVTSAVISFAVITTLFALIFKYVPYRKIPWRNIWPGALLTAAFFSFGKFLISLYLAKSSVAGVYGAAGSFVIMILWVYYSSQIIFFGAEFTYLYVIKSGDMPNLKAVPFPTGKRAGAY